MGKAHDTKSYELLATIRNQRHI